MAKEMSSKNKLINKEMLQYISFARKTYTEGGCEFVIDYEINKGQLNQCKMQVKYEVKTYFTMKSILTIWLDLKIYSKDEITCADKCFLSLLTSQITENELTESAKNTREAFKKLDNFFV